MFRKPKIYYAHCMASYDTPQERTDIRILKSLGFKVINPNSPFHIRKVVKMRNAGKTSSQIMDYFVDVVKTCYGLAFRGMPNGDIPAGVAKEIDTMKSQQGIIIELPELDGRKILTVAQTRAIIRGAKYE